MSEFYTPERDKISNDAAVESRAGLPYVLLIGDSISQAYTPPVRELLKDVCNVERPRANCGDTRAGLRNLDKWIGDRQWGLIHFNWGLHDLCYRHPYSKLYGFRDKINGTLSVPIDEYSRNLELLVQKLLSLKIALVWANSTFIPDGEAGRHQGDEVKYNEAAAAVMSRHGIPVNDLYALTASFDASLFTCPGDVHYAEEGAHRLAVQVAHIIKRQLAATGKIS